jgi:hypothetical protein
MKAGRLVSSVVALVLLSLGLVGPAESAPVCGLGIECEAELGQLRGGAGRNTNHAGYTGTGFVDGMRTGAGIALPVVAAAAGRHDVTIRYANAEGGPPWGSMTRTLTLTAAGTDVPVALPLTGSWSSWSTVTVPVTLPAGISTLDLHVGPDNDGNVNIDHLVVVASQRDPGEGPVEQGVTLRVFDVGIALQRLCTLKPGQTPNADVLRPTVNWSTSGDWAGYTVNYMAQVVADLHAPVSGNYAFRLTSDDGSRLAIAGSVVIDHDGLHGATAKEGSVQLNAGSHPLAIDYFQAGGGAVLKLEWLRPGALLWEVVPSSALTVEGGGARVTSPGIKECEGLGEGPGDGLPLATIHPSFTLTNLRPNAGFQPDVSGLSWFDNGDAAVLTWGKAQESTNGKLYRVSNVAGEVDLGAVTATEIASGLQEPQGVAVVDGEVFVATKTGLDKLLDTGGDGFYEGRQRIATWPGSGNFHEFTFGMPYRDGHFYVALSVALVRSGDSVSPQPAPDRGTLLKVNKDSGAIEYVAGGLLVADNQGGWVPASKLVEIQPGAFYNHPTTYRDPLSGQVRNGRFDDQPVTPPVVWMPHNEISNSPSTPVVMQEGPFAGQLAIGDVTYGGVQRVFLEEVEGQTQGALYRMTQGLEAGVNELAVGPDGDLYVGGIGYDGNWAQPGKLRYGFQKLVANGTLTMDILETRITETGFDLTYTKPLSEETLQDLASRYRVKQWRYNPTSAYGGPKIGEEALAVTGATVSEDGRTVSLEIPGIKPGRVVHIRSPRPFSADDGERLWSTEVWYTANVVPGYVAPADLGYYEAEEADLSAGASVAFDHNGYSGSGFAAGFNNQGATLTFKATVPEAGTHPVHVRYSNGPNPFQGTKRVSLYVNGTKVDPLSLPSTGDWKTWAFVTRNLDLRAGANTITLRYDVGDDGNVNFDLLKVGPDQDICAPAEVEPGHTALFDGTLASFTRWKLAGAGTFGRQADCSLRTEGGMGLLWYAAEELRSYSLKLDWKLVKDDNGGVFVGFPNPGNDPWVAVNQGYEIQIDATDSPDKTTGAIYGFQGADPDAVAASLKPVGSWNAYDIRVTGQRIQVYLNGTLVNDFTSTDANRDLSRGFVGLQNHGGGETVYYRNVRVQAL